MIQMRGLQRAWALGIAALVSVWTAPRMVRACDCDPGTLGPEVMRGWDVVFEGTARRSWIGGRGDDDTRFVEFGVRRAWRGELGGRVRIQTARDDGMCGSRFSRGVSYVVFARRGADGRLTTDTCSFNGPAEDSSEVVRWLGDADVPRSGGGCSAAGSDAGGLVGWLLVLTRRRRMGVHGFRTGVRPAPG